MRTWRSENFFSSSRVRLGRAVSLVEEGFFFCFFGRNEILGEEKAYRCWTLWKPGRRGTGTKMTMAFLPWPTSICVMDRLLVSLRLLERGHAPLCSA